MTARIKSSDDVNSVAVYSRRRRSYSSVKDSRGISYDDGAALSVCSPDDRVGCVLYFHIFDHPRCHQHRANPPHEVRCQCYSYSNGSGSSDGGEKLEAATTGGLRWLPLGGRCLVRSAARGAERAGASQSAVRK